MLKYLVACCASIYCILLLFGDESRRPEVTRQSQDDVTGFSLAAFAVPVDDLPFAATASGISDAEAVQIALAAGRDHRAKRERRPLRGMIAAIEEASVSADTSSSVSDGNLWYVTGSRVNLRAGPGTGNAVVGQVALGDATEVLDDRDGWYQVRTSDGGVSGWIYGKFLAEQQPG